MNRQIDIRIEFFFEFIMAVFYTLPNEQLITATKAMFIAIGKSIGISIGIWQISLRILVIFK